jgi:xanthine/uracil permease
MRTAAPMGWPRALAIAAAIVVAAFVGLVTIPELILTHLDAGDRDVKVVAVTAWFFLALGSLAWALRRLQSRGSL